MDQSQMIHEEKSSFNSVDRKITIQISRSEEIVQDRAGIAKVNTEDITQDSEATSEFSRAKSRVLAIIETEQNSLEESVLVKVTKNTLKLGDGSGKLVKIAVKEVIVVIDESQIVGNNESESSQINIRKVTFSESSKLPSQSNDFSTSSLAGNEVNEGRVSLGETNLGKLSIGGKISLSKEAIGDNILVILTLDNVAEIVLTQHTRSFGFEEILNIDAEASRG